MKVNRKRRLDNKAIEAMWPAAMIMDTPVECHGSLFRFSVRGPKKRVDAETAWLTKRYAEAGQNITIRRLQATLAMIEVQQDPCELICSI